MSKLAIIGSSDDPMMASVRIAGGRRGIFYNHFLQFPIMMRSFVTTILAVGLAVLAVFVFLNLGTLKNETAKIFHDSFNPEVKEGSTDIPRDLPSSPQKTPDTSALFVAGENSNKKAGSPAGEAGLEENPTVQKADTLIQEALAHAGYEEYKTLISIVEKYETDILPLLTDATAAILDLIDRHIFVLAPFYYYVHSDAQPPIRRLLQALRQKHEVLLTELAAQNPALAGEISTSYIKLLIDDIAKSGRRRNSDFVFLSFADYKNYRVFFDKLWNASAEFRRGFALKADTLFTSFYQMHKDVGPDHNAEVRGYLENMREELITLHRKTLRELAAADKKRVRGKVDEIIDLMKNELTLYRDVSAEVAQFIKDDLLSYEELRSEL